MATITLKGNPIHTSGELPAVGSPAPDFLLTKTDLTDLRLADLKGKRVVLNIFPSIDTAVCSLSVRRFNQAIQEVPDAVVLGISRDLPFAHARFCAAEGIEHVQAVSELRALRFGEAYGVRIVDGPLAGLLARAVAVLDASGTVVYTQLVPEIGQEPDYDGALTAVTAKA